jgi:putative addiction module CopG family antidote
MTINLPSDMEQFVKNLVVTGTYASEQEAINEGLRLLMSREQLKAEIAKGLQELDAGNSYDEETVFSELEEEITAIEREKRGG